MSKSQPPALAPLTSADWPEAVADLEASFAGRLNVYRVMAHHPALLRAWADLRQHVVLDTALGRERSEVVILRAATHVKSSYEWNHHLSRARALGMDDRRIASMRGAPSDMDPSDAVLATAVDELMQNAGLRPETRAALLGLVGPEATLDLFATVGFYSTLGFIVNTFETPLDDAVASDVAGHPLTQDPPAP